MKERQCAKSLVEADQDCYLGVWHIDNQGKVCQLFPNEHDKDHFIQAGQPRTIPGQEEYGVRATLSEGPEGLHVMASTRFWSRDTTTTT